ncbi:hypothetical protein Salat_0205400 [Sesamum alatum]|uniref:Uncharacterized protein n=1 Tax=Sesamum alatum TaxID=300844 RepID=A0AAE2CYF8_9LAMI|nr:hypothetical protein Salat_0205400 [Sesamum alatum]
MEPPRERNAFMSQSSLHYVEGDDMKALLGEAAEKEGCAAIQLMHERGKEPWRPRYERDDHSHAKMEDSVGSSRVPTPIPPPMQASQEDPRNDALRGEIVELASNSSLKLPVYGKGARSLKRYC